MTSLCLFKKRYWYVKYQFSQNTCDMSMDMPCIVLKKSRISPILCFYYYKYTAWISVRVLVMDAYTLLNSPDSRGSDLAGKIYIWMCKHPYLFYETFILHQARRRECIDLTASLQTTRDINIDQHMSIQFMSQNYKLNVCK